MSLLICNLDLYLEAAIWNEVSSWLSTVPVSKPQLVYGHFLKNHFLLFSAVQSSCWHSTDTGVLCTYGGSRMRKKRRGVKVGNVTWSPPLRRFSPGSDTPQPLHRTNIPNLSHCTVALTSRYITLDIVWSSRYFQCAAWRRSETIQNMLWHCHLFALTMNTFYRYAKRHNIINPSRQEPG
jgi:hypothetical protein